MKPEEVKKISLGHYPTPLERMERLEKRLQKGPLYIKREDLSEMGLGGNKVRKLEYLVQEAKEQGCSVLLTYGGPQTNHGRLTVAAAVRMGMKAVLILDGDRPKRMSGNLILDGLMGADLRFVGEADLQGLSIEEYRVRYAQKVEAMTRAVIQEYEDRGEKVYVIPVGGSNERGALGYIQMIPELMEQMKNRGLDQATLVCGAGSMGTFAGLWLGAAYYQAPIRVVGISINPQTDFTAEAVCEFIQRVSRMYEMGVTCSPGDLSIYFYTKKTPYAGAGYNVPDADTLSYIQMMAETEAIFLDPCYTGKVFHGYADLLRRGEIPAEGAILLHTGGIPGLWADEHVSAMQEMLGGCQDTAMDRLHRMLSDMKKEQQELTAQLEDMKEKQQDRTYRFKEKMGQKLMNGQVYAKLRAYGLMDEDKES